MPWVKIDDGFHDHPKVAMLPPEYMLPCIGLHLLVLCYCNKNLTDGFIPDPQIDRLAGNLTLLLPQGTSAPLVKALLDVGLWEPAPHGRSGYLVHDFLDYNPSKRTVLTHRREVAQERSLAGRIGNNRRWASQLGDRSEQTASQNDRKLIAKRSQSLSQNDRPVPVPVVEKEKKGRPVVLADDRFIEALKANPAYLGLDIDRELGKLDAWLLTPRGQGKQKTRQRIVNWLNRAERPFQSTAAGPKHRPNHSLTCDCPPCEAWRRANPTPSAEDGG